MKKDHIPGPIPPGNQTHAGPKHGKADHEQETDTDQTGSLEKGGERVAGDRQDVRNEHVHPASRLDGNKG